MTAPVPLVAVTGSLLLGGSSTFLVNLAGAFARRGLTLPIVVLSEENEHAADFARVGNPVHGLSRARLIFEDRLAAAYQAVAGHRPQTILSCLGSESFELLRLVPPGVGRLAVVQSHEPGPYGLMRSFGPWIDVAVGVSRLVEQELASTPELQGARKECIPYGIEFDEAPPGRDPASDAPLRLIYLGRLIEEQKRVSRLVELVDQLERRGVNATLTIAGAGPDEASLRAAMAGKTAVRFTGAVSNREARRLLADSDVMVLLSDYEGLPLSLLEAMGQGVVPVVSDLPSGMRDVVGEGCGFRTPVGDVGRAVEVIATLAADREALSAHSQRALAFVREHYSAERMADRYLEVIRQVAKPEPFWPEEVEIPAPLGVRPWLYRGPMRRLRRALKPWLSRR